MFIKYALLDKSTGLFKAVPSEGTDLLDSWDDAVEFADLLRDTEPGDWSIVRVKAL
ncbi:hypothetical protein [Halorubellus litoreus]|uniref:Uncharacterized protein n=1 Tax=Halorubellus litoreus TaxID=755308 RepID=A0ABD5VF94_9EURY